MSVTSFVVGEPFVLYEDRPLPLNDASQLLMSKLGHLMLVITLNNMTEREIDILWDNRIRVGLIEGPDNMVEILFGFENTDLLFETTFDPCLYNDDRIVYASHNKQITILGIEATNNRICSLQILQLPNQLHKKLISTWMNLPNKNNYSTRYNKWIDNLRNNFDMLQLWRSCEDYGLLE